MSICPSFTHSEGRKQDALEATKHLHENDAEGTSENPNDAKLKRAAERRLPLSLSLSLSLSRSMFPSLSLCSAPPPPADF